MENSSNSVCQDLEDMQRKGHNNEELKIYKKNSEKSINNLLVSISEFEQHSVNTSSNSDANVFNPKCKKIESSLFNSNELTESSPKLKMSQSNCNGLEIKRDLQSDIYPSRKKLQSLEKICILDSLPYDSDFKKPHFLRYSFFDDDIASFKDESSPNLLSTAASSLSSLTIDDDDYSDNVNPNKAGLVKTKLNIIDIPQVQKSPAQEYWRQDPIGSAYEPSKISNLIENKQIFNIRSDEFLKNSVDKQKITNKISNIYSSTDSYQNQKEYKKRIIWTDHNISDLKKSNSNLTSNQYLKNMQSIRSEAEGSTKENRFRNELYIQNIVKDKFNNIYEENQIFNNCNKAELTFGNKCGRNNKCERHKEQKFSEQNRFPHDQSNNEISYLIDESNELNAYEEQLLDQCIRRGMAKVTKRHISDIKPFCWDLNQICLTTRAMLKTHDENIMRER